MVSHPAKIATPSVNLQSLPLTDQQILHRAAALLNKSVAELLQDPAEGSSQSYPSDISQYISTADSQQWMTPDAHPTNIWLPGPHFQQLAQPQSGPYIVQAAQSSDGRDMQPASTRSTGRFTRQETLSSATPPLHLNNCGEYQALEAQQSDIVQNRFFPVHPFGSQNSNFGVNEAASMESDSPEVSDNEKEENTIDSQPWENVQINSVDQLISTDDAPDSDYHWLDDSEVNQAEDLRYASQPARIESRSKDGENAKSKGRKPFQDKALRAETSNTRKLKACVRCRMQKIRVNKHVMIKSTQSANYFSV
jgi:hypothetical protein